MGSGWVCRRIPRLRDGNQANLKKIPQDLRKLVLRDEKEK